MLRPPCQHALPGFQQPGQLALPRLRKDSHLPDTSLLLPRPVSPCPRCPGSASTGLQMVREMPTHYCTCSQIDQCGTWEEEMMVNSSCSPGMTTEHWGSR